MSASADGLDVIRRGRGRVRVHGHQRGALRGERSLLLQPVTHGTACTNEVLGDPIFGTSSSARPSSSFLRSRSESLKWRAECVTCVMGFHSVAASADRLSFSRLGSQENRSIHRAQAFVTPAFDNLEEESPFEAPGAGMKELPAFIPVVQDIQPA